MFYEGFPWHTACSSNTRVHCCCVRGVTPQLRARGVYEEVEMKKLFSKLVLLAVFASIAPVAHAEDCWDATYVVGGYNLYSFGVDMYNTYDYCAPVQQPVCCDSCYDTATLYNPYTEANISQLTQMVSTNQQLINQLYGLNPYSQIPGITNPGFGGNPYVGPNLGVIPPVSGNPYNPYNPYNPFVPSNPNPYYPPITGIPPYSPTNPISPYFPTYPTSPTTPTINYPVNPSVPTNPSLPRPPSLPPFGGCDNITVMCPVTPSAPGTPTVSLPQNPNLAPGYQTNTNQVGQDPTRYRVPRGTRNH